MDRIIKHNRQCESQGNEAEKLTIHDIVGVYNLFYFAGTDTSMAASTSVLCYISQKPELKAQLRRMATSIYESQSVCKNLETNPDLNDFVTETLRLFSPLQRQLGRVALKDTKLGNIMIKKGDWIFVQFSIMHKSKNNFEEPYTFKLGRFKEQNYRHQYMPFGYGKRICLGRNLGELMIKVLVSKMAYCYDIEKPSKCDYYFYSFITARPEDPVVSLRLKA